MQKENTQRRNNSMSTSRAIFYSPDSVGWKRNQRNKNLSTRNNRFTGSIFFLLVLLHCICWIPTHTAGIRWLGIYRLPRSADHPADTSADRFTLEECEKSTNELGLRRRQMRFCAHPRFGYAMLAVLRAAHAVGYHCPKAFADRRWNCTSIHQLPEVSPELQRGTREQALVHAFSSAALLFEIGRYCALNKIRHCSCGEETGAYPISEYTPDTGMVDQNSYRDPGNALLYESSGAHGNPSHMSQNNQGANPSQMTEGQPTVSRFYWAGCSDNLRVAREYTSAFLGFPNLRVLTLPPAETEEKISTENEDTKLERFGRSVSLLDENEDDDEDSYSEELSENPSRVRRNLNHNWPYRTANSQQSQQSSNYESMARHFAYGTQSRPTNDFRQAVPYAHQQWTRRLRSRQKRKRSSIVRVLNRHNYLAGVVLMEANQKLVCKCHGVSGSCAQRVCFRQLRRIDNEIMQKALKMRYLAAKQVTQGSNRQLIAKTFTGNGFIDEVVKPEELVYSEHSPDYCNVEPQRGSVGTSGRLCTLKDSGTANCVNMCCGRGYRNVTTNEVVQCNCRMGEGFKVKCDECNVKVVTHRCL